MGGLSLKQVYVCVVLKKNTPDNLMLMRIPPPHYRAYTNPDKVLYFESAQIALDPRPGYVCAPSHFALILVYGLDYF